MINFQYSGFWDVPLGVAVVYWGRTFVLMRHFDEERDEYDDQYSVYVLPEPVASVRHVCLSEGFWKNLHEENLTKVGQVSISIRFDPTKRKQLDASILDKFVNETLKRNA